MLFLAFVLVGIVIYMCVPKNATDLSVQVYTSFRTVTLVCMIFASAMVKSYIRYFDPVKRHFTVLITQFQVFHRMSKFEADKFSSLFMDDVLLILCLPAIFYFHFLILLPIIIGEDQYSMGHIVTSILMVRNTKFQTTLC